MKKQFIFLFTTLFLCKTLSAQGVEFTVNLSNDTVLLGNYIEVEYTISNGDGKFIPPLFAGLQLIAGPNKSSSYSVINGVVSQSASYTYYFSTDETGNYIIPPAELEIGGKIIKSTPVKIYVAPNPDNIRQRPRNDFDDNEDLPRNNKSKKKIIKL